MKILLLPLLRPLLACPRSLRISPVPQQCPHGQAHQSPHGIFLKQLQFSLSQNLQLLLQSPRHLRISPLAKGPLVSLLLQEHLQVL